MKKWIITLILIFLFPIAGLSIWYTSGQWMEGKDELCGETVHYWWEGGTYSGSSTWGGGLPLLDKEREMYLEASIRTGLKCYEKYKDEFNKLIKDWVVEKQKENAELITKYKEERRLKEVKQKKLQIKQLKIKLEELEK